MLLSWGQTAIYGTLDHSWLNLEQCWTGAPLMMTIETETVANMETMSLGRLPEMAAFVKVVRGFLRSLAADHPVAVRLLFVELVIESSVDRMHCTN